MNNQIFFSLYGLAHQSNFFDNVIIFFAVYFPYIVVFLAGVFLLMHHEFFKAESPWQILMQKKFEILSVFFSGGVAWVVAKILKFLIHVPRPFEKFPAQVQALFSETGYAFPSGHATFYLALAVAILFSHKKAGLVFMLFALLIGLARIIAGVHFPIDILGGFILGTIVSSLCRLFYPASWKRGVPPVWVRKI